MSNLHRIQWIDIQIRSEKFPNCKKISRHFEISQRQALRDIEYLRDSLNAPVEFSREKNGYFYSDLSYSVPNLLISSVEQKALVLLAEKYKSAKTGVSQDIARLFEKLAGLPTTSTSMNKLSEQEKSINDIRQYELNRKEMDFFYPINDAIRDKIKLKIDYLNKNFMKSTRLVHPYRLFNKDNYLYLAAYCEIRDEIRIFRCDRIEGLALTGRTFEMPSSSFIDDYLERYIFIFRRPYVAKIELKKNVGIQKLRTVFKTMIFPCGNNFYDIDFFSSDEFISALMLLNTGFIIHSPSWLKSRVRNKLADIIANIGQ